MHGPNEARHPMGTALGDCPPTFRGSRTSASVVRTSNRPGGEGSDFLYQKYAVFLKWFAPDHPDSKRSRDRRQTPLGSCSSACPGTGDEGPLCRASERLVSWGPHQK
jgi:hypothetical protein